MGLFNQNADPWIMVATLLAIIFIPRGDMRAQLTRPSVITGDSTSELIGEVFDPLGASQSSEVRAFLIVIQRGHASLSQQCRTETDSNGRYRCPQLAAGRYLLAVRPVEQPPDGSQATRLKYASRPTTFYPGTVDIDSAAPILVDHATSVEADLALQSARLFTIRGTLPDDASRASLSFLKGRGDGYDIDMSDLVIHHANSRAFSVSGIPSGLYHVSAQWLVNKSATSVGVHHGTLAVVVPNNDIDDLIVTEDSSSTLKGSVSVATETYLGYSFNWENIVLVNEISGAEIGAPVDRQGHFLFPDISAGTYTVRYGDVNTAYVKSVSQDGLPSDKPRVVVSAGRHSIRMQVEISTRTAAIHGSLKNWVGDVGPGLVLAKSEDSGCFYTGRAGVDGVFTVKGLPPGEYSVYAWESLEGIEYANRKNLERYADAAVHVFVTEAVVLGDLNLEIIPHDR